MNTENIVKKFRENCKRDNKLLIDIKEELKYYLSEFGEDEDDSIVINDINFSYPIIGFLEYRIDRIVKNKGTDEISFGIEDVDDDNMVNIDDNVYSMECLVNLILHLESILKK